MFPLRLFRFPCALSPQIFEKTFFNGVIFVPEWEKGSPLLIQIFQILRRVRVRARFGRVMDENLTDFLVLNHRATMELNLCRTKQVYANLIFILLSI